MAMNHFNINLIIRLNNRFILLGKCFISSGFLSFQKLSSTHNNVIQGVGSDVKDYHLTLHEKKFEAERRRFPRTSQ